MASQIKVDQITDKLGTGTPSFPHGIDAGDLTGTLPAIDGSAITDLNAAELTGALPAIDGSALTGVGGSTTAGDVGTYAFVNRYSGDMDFGSTIAGSNIRPCYVHTRTTNTYGNGSEAVVYAGSSYGTLLGTWRLMSDADAQGTKTYMFLAVRIS